MFDQIASLAQYVRTVVTGESIDYTINETGGTIASIIAVRARVGSGWDGNVIRYGSDELDWLVEAALIPGRKPERGDRITCKSNGNVFIVAPYDDSDDCWRPSDSHRFTFRIHTKKAG